MSLLKDAKLAARVIVDPNKTPTSPEELREDWKKWALDLLAQEVLVSGRNPQKMGQPAEERRTRASSYLFGVSMTDWF